jgi:adenine-specific DNA-methyltransferase
MMSNNLSINTDNDLLNFNKCDIFTPDHISELMASKLLTEGNLLEPSVGEGSLLTFLNLDNYDSIDIFDIKQKYLDKCPSNKKIKKHCRDFIKSDINKKYKNIILNPPFIKIQDLSSEYVEFIKSKWTILDNGNIDLYYAFLIKCIELLDDDGVMVAITPNSYLCNKSSIQLRKYFIENRFIREIIDFGSEKVFSGIAVYCCVTVFTKMQKSQFLYNNQTILYENIGYPLYNIFEIKSDVNENIPTLKLKDVCRIYNGIATLRDAIFIHKTKLFEEPCWKEITNSKIIQYVIFPYQSNGEIIEEEIFKQQNPQTYKYLEEQKDELAKRDNGNKTYPKWYSFGRTQSLKVSKMGKLIYMPAFVNPDNLNVKIDTPKLHYSCLCIEPKKIEDIEQIIKSINDNIDYIKNNSPKRNNGWLNLSTRVLNEIPFI